MTADDWREHDHPRELSGKFTEKANSEPESRLKPPRSHLLKRDEADAAINMGFPTPQANNLSLVMSATEEVASGVRNGEEMSDALGVHRSEGGFYAAAAGLLGLVDRESDGGLYVTELGERVMDMQPEDRSRAVLELANAYPGVRAFQEGGYDGAERFLRGEAELSDTTVERRMETLRAWAEAVSDGHVAPLSGEFSGSKNGRPARRKLDVTVRTCGECWLIVPDGRATCVEHPAAEVLASA